MQFDRTIPILRISSPEKAKEFYVEYLGFRLQWEHRFAEDLSLYMAIARDGCILHLSEHHGDGSPGSAIRIQVEDIAGFHAQLSAKQYGYARPELVETSWQTREFSVTDPFLNSLRFFEELGDHHARQP